MKLDKKIKQIQKTAEQVLNILGLTIHEDNVWEADDAMVFSWIFSKGPVLINLPKESIHFGFGMTKDEIDNHFMELDINWFMSQFQETMNKSAILKPEETIEKVEYNE